MTTGERIRVARKAANMTQKELAEKMGIPYQGIGQWERNKRKPKVDTLSTIAAILGCDITELLDPSEYNIEIVLKPSDISPIVAQKYREQISVYMDGLNDGSSVIITHVSDEKRLLSAFENLNALGRERAVEYVQSLAELPRYQRSAAPGDPEAEEK